MALNYLLSLRFWVDLFSTLPFDNMFQSMMSPSANQLLSLLGMLKLFRASRISTVIARLKFERDIKAYFKLGLMVCTLILWIHIYGCLFYYSVSFYISLIFKRLLLIIHGCPLKITFMTFKHSSTRAL
jgi:hypothetical protein